ncbi:MAG: hypothetical protein AAB421_01685 [Patescibacteria group bacterium]
MFNFGKVKVLWDMRRDPECTQELMRMYWGGLLSCLALVVVCASLYGTYAHYFGRASEVFTEDRKASGDLLKLDGIDKVLESFEQRALQFDRALESVPTVQDPHYTIDK